MAIVTAAEPDLTASSSDQQLAEEITNTLLRVINSIGRNKTRSFGPDAELTLVEAELCYRIHTHENVTGAELAEVFGVTRSAVSQVLTRLRNKGFISEHTAADDRKRKQLRLTPRGRKAADTAMGYFELMSKEIYGESREELEAYLRFVTKLEAFHVRVDSMLADRS